MPNTTVTRTIDAPIGLVFQTVADIRTLPRAMPLLLEILSDVKSGVGTRFRNEDLAKRMETATELEVTEHVENQHMRIVADFGGIIWDSVFTVKRLARETELTVRMNAEAYKLLPKLRAPLIMIMIAKAIAADLDSVKEYCEAKANLSSLRS